MAAAMRLVDARREIRIVALEDALERAGQARWDVVLDRLVARFPEVRTEPREFEVQVRLVVSEVNGLDRPEQQEALAELDPAYARTGKTAGERVR